MKRSVSSGSMLGRVAMLMSVLALPCLPVVAGHMPKTLANHLAEQSTPVEDGLRLVVKFDFHSGVRIKRGQLQWEGERASDSAEMLGALMQDLARYGLHPKPVFPETVVERLALEGDPTGAVAELETLISMRLGRSTAFHAAGIVQLLNAYPIVQVAYIEIPVSLDLTPTVWPLPGGVAPGGLAPLLIGHQGYLQAAPFGLGVLPAWRQPAATGHGVKVMLYDNGIRTTHEDLPDISPASNSQAVGLAQHAIDHGTAAMSVMAARHNGFGLTGIAYDASFGFLKAAAAVGKKHGATLLALADDLGPGDVVLIEVGTIPALGFTCPDNPGQANQVPLEFLSDVSMAIEVLVAKGITVVQGAGNGCVDFDDPMFAGMFTGDGDTGSIWVGAAETGAGQSTPYQAIGYTGYGQRVDLHAWGKQVAAFSYTGKDACHGKTPENPCEQWLYFDGDPDRLYVNNFRGTSAASALVAGVAAAVQGYWKTVHGHALTPEDLRALLSLTGTPQGSNAEQKPIGKMPNMKAAMLDP